MSGKGNGSLQWLAFPGKWGAMDRILMIVIDGLGDQAQDDLGRRTPLQVAYTPNLNHLALLGGCGLYHGLGSGVILPSDLAHFLLLGYPVNQFPGRGYLEALGAGMDTPPNTAFFVAQGCWIDDRGTLVESRAQLDPDQWNAVLDSIPTTMHHGGQRLTLHPVGPGEAIVEVEGGSHEVSDTHPLVPGSPALRAEPFEKGNEKARATAELLNRYLVEVHRQLLSRHPQRGLGVDGGQGMNAILTWGGGRFRILESLEERWGLKGASLAAGSAYKGLSLALGMDHEELPELKDPGDDLLKRLQRAERLLEDYDLIYLHVMAIHRAAHTRNPWNKVEAIESLDRALPYLAERFVTQDGLLTVITGDHSIPSSGFMLHSGEPVPLLIIGNKVRRGETRTFDEVAVAQGSLGFLRGAELMHTILSYTGRGNMFGRYQGPQHRPYFSPQQAAPMPWWE